MYHGVHDLRQVETSIDDSCGEQLPHIWFGSTPNLDHLKAFIGSVTGYGSVAAMNVVEESLLPGVDVTGLASRNELQAGFELGDKISAVLAGTRPLRWAGVHFSETARNRFQRDTRGAWETLILPSLGGFEAFVRQGVPITVLTDETLTSGSANDLDVLFVSDQTTTPKIQSAIDAFDAAGGTLISGVRHAGWSSSVEYEAGVEEVTVAASPSIASAPVSVTGSLPTGVHLVPHRSILGGEEARVVLAVMNRFDFVQQYTFRSLPSDIPVNPAPPPVQAGIEVVLLSLIHI